MRPPVLYRETSDVVIPMKRIESDTLYGQALETFVALCTDCIFINKDRRTIYLAKRKARPMAGAWS